jgi:hypothetical protein|nr:MAG TPA: NADH-PPase NADH pyrophosphatase zinc ribbon domain [Bacteriophage sp.]
MCEFCKNIMPFSYGISTYSNMGIAIGGDIKPHIYITTFNEDDGLIVTLSDRHIRFCPICGRKLA